MLVTNMVEQCEHPLKTHTKHFVSTKIKFHLSKLHFSYRYHGHNNGVQNGIGRTKSVFQIPNTNYKILLEFEKWPRSGEKLLFLTRSDLFAECPWYRLQSRSPLPSRYRCSFFLLFRKQDLNLHIHVNFPSPARMNLWKRAVGFFCVFFVLAIK